MDAIHYAKIADQLMQFRGKLPNWDHVHTEYGRDSVERINFSIERMLAEIDRYARADEKGWIK